MVARDQHDGFRCIARKNGKRVRLYSLPGNDLSRRFTAEAKKGVTRAASFDNVVGALLKK
jgi:ATP-dependent DNA ligase